MPAMWNVQYRRKNDEREREERCLHQLFRTRRNSTLSKVLIALLLFPLLPSCSLSDDEEIFDRSASRRVQDRIEETQRVLEDAEYGWELEYYPDNELSYGGIVYTVKFDSINAKVQCSLVPGQEETSLYKLTSDNGPVLSFDTYNSLLHYFSTPSSGEYEAKRGEFEFVIENVSNDLITLYGKKTKNNMRLHRLHSSADEYAEKTTAVFDHLPLGFKGTIAGKSIEGAFRLNDKSVLFVSDNDSISTHFAFCDTGLRLYQPVMIGNGSVSAFRYDPTTDALAAVTDEGTLENLQPLRADSATTSYNDYAGSYLLRYNGNKSSIRVSLQPHRLDATYRLRGLSKHYEPVFRYDFSTGNLVLCPQVVGDINGSSVYLATYNVSTGSLWIAEEASFTLKYNGNKIYPAYNFTATHPETYPCDSALLIELYYNDSGALAARLITNDEWVINGSAVLSNLNSLSKLRN